MNSKMPALFAVCSVETVHACRASEADGGLLQGHIKDGMVYQVTRACQPGHAAGRRDVIGSWIRSADPGAVAHAPGPLVLAIEADKATFWLQGRHSLPAEPVPSMIYDLKASLFLRHRDLVDQSVLRAKVVAIIGVGTIGSGVALLLATAGVGRFILIDPDRVEPHNVIRHLCGLSDLGRFKVDAVADRLRDKNPEVTVTALPKGADEPEVLEVALEQADLVIATTDSPRVQLMINSACLEAGKPVVFAAVYNFAFGGEVVRVIPGKTTCLRCASDGTADLFNRVEPGEDGQTRPYDADRGHPGMWIDVGPVNHLAARMAVETLQGAADPGQNLVGDYLLWGNRRMWAFRHPLDHHWLTIPRNPSCPACGGPGALDARLAALGMTRQEAAEAGKELLDSPELAPGDADLDTLLSDLERSAAPGDDAS